MAVGFSILPDPTSRPQQAKAEYAKLRKTDAVLLILFNDSFDHFPKRFIVKL